MENSTVECAAVAAAQNPAVPLSALIYALSALERVAELPITPLLPEGLWLQVVQARNLLEACVLPILRAQQVGVTA